MKYPEQMTFAELCEEMGYRPLNRPLTREECAAFLGVTPHTLDQNRSTGTGINPPSCRPPGSRRRLYPEKLLLIFVLKGLRTDPTSAAA